MYYLKYRPRTIEELDNLEAKEALSNILKSKSLPHAYLFAGQKGTGKTSTARIFAKAVNCLDNALSGKNRNIDPCNSCTNCVSIEASSSADVTELDAASNRGIEEVRTIIRESTFAPMTGKYRIFIIDEAHMITTDAFNALLKTLEEPSDTVIFILATTNEEKVPKTIQSRCVKVIFGKAKKEQVAGMLRRIIKNEKIDVSEETINFIISRSDNSFRDAAKILEELVIQNKLTPEKAAAYLNVREHTSLIGLFETTEPAKVFRWINEFSETGGNFKYLIEELLEELRVQLLIKSGLKIEEAKESKLTKSQIMKLIKLISESYSLMRVTPIDSLPLEIAVAEFYNK